MSLRLKASDAIANAAIEKGDLVRLRLPDPRATLGARAQRCDRLAEGHALGDYLRFVAALARAQGRWLACTPACGDADALRWRANLARAVPPLDVATWPCDEVLRSAVRVIAADLANNDTMSEAVRACANGVSVLEDGAVDALVGYYRAGDYAAVGAALLPFVSAALSVYWSRLATTVDVAAAHQEEGHDANCPVCASAPAVSVISVGSSSGLRYLHCALCESEWHVVRALCSACGSGRDIDYFSLDSARDNAVRAEACTACGSYLKVLYPEFDPTVDAVADDLASLALDLAMSERGLERSGPCLYLAPD